MTGPGPGALSMFGDALPTDPAADACPACGGTTTRRGRECLPCLAAGVTAPRLDLTGTPDADQREQNPYLSTEAWRSAHAITPKPNRPELVARDVARDLAPAALADWPQPYPAP